MSDTFLDLLRRRGIEGPLPRADCGGPAGQDVRPAGRARAWDFAQYNPWSLSGDAQLHFGGSPGLPHA